MKSLIILLFTSLSLSFACQSESIKNENETEMNETPITATSNKINIKIGSKTFTATLLDNATSEAFVAQLPLTINMMELNNNEKYAQLPKSVPTSSSVPTRIEAGDLMMYGSSTLVLFYKGFSTSYSYTKIGKIDDVTGLVAALGTGDLSISFYK